jgi:hypothetical protein
MPSAALDQSIQVELKFLIILLVDNSDSTKSHPPMLQLKRSQHSPLG